MRRAALAIGMFAACCAASAEEPTRVYLGGAAGPTRMKNACEGAPSAISCDSGDVALKIFSGYQFTRHLALEFGLNLLGTAQANSGEKAELSAVDASAILSWPLANRFSIYARLGAYYGAMKIDQAMVIDDAVPVVLPPPPPPPPSPRTGWRSGTNAGPTFGLGASYALTPESALRVEWQRFSGLGTPAMDLDVVSLGLVYRF